MPEPLRQVTTHRLSSLYVVATPIGNLGDMTPRAVEILHKVDLIAAEDTRHSKKLLNHFDIKTPLVAYHDFSGEDETGKILDKLQQGKDVALISDAGTPLVSDPGYTLVKAAHQLGVKVVPVPGACASIAALSAAGLPSDRFLFIGFLPSKPNARRQQLEGLARESATMVLYEAPHRLAACLECLLAVFGEERKIVLARELTKTFETVISTTIKDLLAFVEADLNQKKGEVVLVVHGYETDALPEINEESVRILDILAQELPLTQAAALTAKITGLKKRALYQFALDRKSS
ncbi:MAG: 16S rRNA (cytidine(1402)-2'-O)-methyltransferase [Pseudomonadales bacterium]|nr:16S rRNA (cytidine(1402)-2'-O)-methyltransferase [Pseudomonadales bacterium]